MMEHSASSARAVLELLEESRSQVARLRRKIQLLESRATSVTAQYGPKAGGGQGQGPAEVWNELADRKKELELRESRLDRQEKQLSRWIDQLPRPRWRMVLRYRYLDGMEFLDIAEAMTAATGREFSVYQIYRLHSKALEAASQQWPI